MKKIILFFFLFSITFISKAQTYFGTDDCWTDYYVNWDTNITNGKDQYYLSGDTLLEGRIYKKMIERSPNNLQQPTSYLGAIREEAGKVFARYKYYESLNVGEFLLYDFTVKVGDTIRSTAPYGDLSQKPVVMKIDTIVLLTGEKRKRYIFKNASDCIEGVGCINGFFSPAEPTILGYGIPYLVCYKRGGISYYTDSSYCNDGSCCDILTGLENPAINMPTCSVSPNPTTRFVKLDLSRTTTTCKSIKLTDAIGNILQISTTIKSNEPEMDLLNYPSGLYFVIIEFDKNYEVKKIIKL